MPSFYWNAAIDMLKYAAARADSISALDFFHMQFTVKKSYKFSAYLILILQSRKDLIYFFQLLDNLDILRAFFLARPAFDAIRHGL